MNKKYGVWAVAACAALAMGVSGCGKDSDDKADKGGDKTAEKPVATSGVEKLSAQEIAEKAKTELVNAKSMRLKADGTDGGKPMTMDLAFDSTGSCRGSMSMGDAGSFELIKLADKVWMKPDDAFYKSQIAPGEGGAEAAKLFKGKWLHGSTSDPMLKSMSEVCDLKGMQAKMAEDTKKSTFTKGAPETQNGQQVIPLKGKDSDGQPETMYVAITGKPYPVKVVSSGKDGGTMVLSDYDKPIAKDTPTAGETIDVSKLQEELGGGA
ncbi:hypothetical protein [Streptomyces palmae]|uniref:Lipoprotein n=1 Tax=Streptomyces palmae TaxID=1701085 RepID=A0A4Z0GE48_9ACTN|nr:hypothetical protein [Streptomyces palmae]TGA93815.1 hypothetical protein E4099_26355 [Streptomyces palmae]